MFSVAFEGPDGSGKTTAALAFYQLLTATGRRARILSLDDGSDDLVCRLLKDLKQVPRDQQSRVMPSERLLFAAMYRMMMGRVADENFEDIDCIIFDRWHPLSDLVFGISGRCGCSPAQQVALSMEHEQIRQISIPPGHRTVTLLAMLNRCGKYLEDYFDGRRASMQSLYAVAHDDPDRFHAFLEINGLFVKQFCPMDARLSPADIADLLAAELYGSDYLLQGETNGDATIN